MGVGEGERERTRVSGCMQAYSREGGEKERRREEKREGKKIINEKNE